MGPYCSRVKTDFSFWKREPMNDVKRPSEFVSDCFVALFLGACIFHDPHQSAPLVVPCIAAVQRVIDALWAKRTPDDDASVG
jgi:hypothetical protein